MGACRETFKMSHHWSNGSSRDGKVSFRMGITNIYYLLKRSFRNKWDMKCFMKDNFYTPYFQSLGCKITPHKFYWNSEDREYFCTRCYHRISEKKYDMHIRNKKLKEIL